MGGRGYAGRRGIKGGKWDNCNTIINKIYFKKSSNRNEEKNMSHMEEQNKTPEKDVNKMETSNLSHAELKTMNLGEE